MGEPRAAGEPGVPRAAALCEVALLFLRLGTTAFGGPAAHVAMMEDEVVRRRRWLTGAEFLDLFGAANLIPGPSSTEMAILIGRQRAGWAGVLAAGTGFILPAALMVAGIAWAYVRFGSLPQVAGLLYGVKPVVIAVIVQALWALGRTALKTKLLVAVGLAALGAGFLGVNVALVLIGTGAIVALGRWVADHWKPAGPPGALLGAVPFGLVPLFLFFLKVGATLFGSGYVLLAYLRADLVQHYGWLSEGQLLDAVAVGQVTPGPVFTTATFIGYVLGGAAGAVVATVGIFLPAFVYVPVASALLPRLRGSPVAGAFLDGTNVAALALMAMVSWQLGRAAIVDVTTAALAAVSAVLLIRFRVNATWLVVGGALVGLVARAGRG